GGLEYKIIGGSGDKEIKYGNTIKFTAYSYYSDSLMSTPYDSIPQLMEVDSTKLPPEYIQIFKSAKKGDSIITRIPVDTIRKMNPNIPPFAKSGQYLGYRFKILDVITDPALADVMKRETMERLRRLDSISVIKQSGIDDKILSDYLAKNNITATKTEKGTYVEVQNPGTGEQVTVGKAITVDYKGMTLAGHIFDQSYDSTGKSLKPYTFMVGQRGAIEGWPDGLVYFKKGGKGRLFIPSQLAYGSRGQGPEIPANTPLIFEVSVVDVMPAEAYQKKMEEQQKMMQQLQQMQQQQQPQGQTK
ncbi:MAG: FKBP-type peptidyl-prolyl cis-trans isomerase, partial [Ginsengibacter sp.]